MALDIIPMLMEIVMKVNGKMMNSLEVVHIILLMEVNIKDLGDMVHQKAKEHLYMIVVKVQMSNYILVGG
jgi:hypothetical protein